MSKAGIEIIFVSFIKQLLMVYPVIMLLWWGYIVEQGIKITAFLQFSI